MGLLKGYERMERAMAKSKKTKKRKFTKAQKVWLESYQQLCFDLEPMYMDDYLAGECTFEELKRGNIRWTRDHFDEVIANLERLP